jgi:hypothetical protein
MAKTKISLEELNRKIADPTIPEEELAQYFNLDEARSDPMAPALKLDETTVETPPPSDVEGRARSALLLNNVNRLSRMRRQRAFHLLLGSGKYKGPIIVEEGDSWFQYPMLLKDTIDHLSEDYAIFSLGAAGDTLDNMVAQAEYVDALQATGASILLLSGGGNDLVAGGNLAKHLRPFMPGLAPEAYLLKSFDRLLDTAMGHIDTIARQVGRAFPQVEVICHGYDYALPAAGKWLGKPMETRGITDKKLQRDIARIMVDRLNSKLRDLATQTQRLTYVDCRSIVGEGRWHDELHPTNEGYGDVARRFKATIKALKPATRGAAKKPPTPPRVIDATRPDAPRRRAKAATPPAAARAVGRSLHVGLNLIDPRHYEGWDGALSACEFDAMDMADIAGGVGYEATTLLTKDATLDAVTAAITAAAKASKPGDIFLFTYAGHGGQITDFNGDEADGIDETLCLYDGQLIDDELYVLWSAFPPDTRILVVSDCCHSGTNIRAQIVEDAAAANPPPTGRPRAMPRSVAARVVRRHRAFYEDRAAKADAAWRGAATREMALPVSASVRLISACQDNQVAMDGLENGLFTSRLRQAWGDGAFRGDYAAFHRAIRDRMPPEQSPNHIVEGEPSPAFDAQRPFDI